MKKFLFVYNASPEPGTETDQDWMNWFGTIGENLVDVGNPFNGGKLVKGGESSDLSSFADFVGGYSLISAADIDEAVSIAKGCPSAAGVRVFEAIPM